MNSSKNDIVEEATQVVDNHITLLKALYEARKTQEEARSNRVCRCSSCKSHREMTLSWVESMLEKQPSVG